MRIETLMISLFLFAFGTVGCSQPEPVKAEYEPADCNCVEQTTSIENTGAEEAPPAKTDGLANEAAQQEDEAVVVATTELTDQSGEHPEEAEQREESKEETKSAKAGDPNGVVNLNTASLEQLMALPGVGPSLATRIVEFRKERRFEEVKHLLRVKGIGQAKFSKLQPMLAVSGETTLVKK